MSDGNKTNLIVNYLPQTLTDEEFRSIFLSIGPIRATKIVRDRVTNYSYGFGFVDFVSEEDAMKAIDKINGMQVQNKRLKVAYSRNHDDAKKANLYVRNLPRHFDEDLLKNLFSQFGEIVNARILKDQFTGQSKGIGFVLYNKGSEAVLAMERLHNAIPPGGTEKLNVKHAEDNVGKARPPHGGGAGGMGMGAAPTSPTSYYNNGMSSMGRGGYMGSYNGMMGNGGGPLRGGGAGGAGRRFNPMQQYQQGNQYMTGGYNVDENSGYTLFVYNIGLDAEETTLWQLFSPYGLIERVNCMRDHDKNCCKGFGFVTFLHLHEAQNAIHALNGYRFKGRPLQVKFKN